MVSSSLPNCARSSSTADLADSSSITAFVSSPPIRSETRLSLPRHLTRAPAIRSPGSVIMLRQPAVAISKALSRDNSSARKGDVNSMSSLSVRKGDLAMPKLFQLRGRLWELLIRLCRTYSPTASSLGSS